MRFSEIVDLIGKGNGSLLKHSCSTVVKEQLSLPSPNFIEMVLSDFNCNGQTLRSFIALFNTGRLLGSGYLSVLPVDQGVEYSAGDCDVPNSYCLIF
jgi:class I fructose-bisphosphate aldolase